jgi:hypothetical protein
MKRDYCYYVRKQYWFLFDNHTNTIVRQNRYLRNMKRNKSVFSLIKRKTTELKYIESL